MGRSAGREGFVATGRAEGCAARGRFLFGGAHRMNSVLTDAKPTEVGCGVRGRLEVEGRVAFAKSPGIMYRNFE